MWEITALDAFNTALDLVGALLVLVLIASMYIHKEQRRNVLLLMTMHVYAISIIADAGT